MVDVDSYWIGIGVNLKRMVVVWVCWSREVTKLVGMGLRMDRMDELLMVGCLDHLIDREAINAMERKWLGRRREIRDRVSR